MITSSVAVYVDSNCGEQVINSVFIKYSGTKGWIVDINYELLSLQFIYNLRYNFSCIQFFKYVT